MKKNLDFDPITHSYTVDGLKVPSVTQILSAVGLSDYSRVPKNVLEEASVRGSAVHRIIEMSDMGQLIECPEWARGYLSAWERFLIEKSVCILECETIIFNEKLRYAGTLDRVALVSGKTYILEIKTTQEEMRGHQIQTAGYKLAYKPSVVNRCPVLRAAVYVRADGTYSFKEHTRPGAENVFLSALQVYRW
jgi:hypothetical protein